MPQKWKTWDGYDSLDICIWMFKISVFMQLKFRNGDWKSDILRRVRAHCIYLIV
jgi:hypothetical protein